MFEIMPESEGNVVGVKVSGTLVDEDYKKLIPEIDKRIKEVGELKFLLDLKDLEGFTCKALLDDETFCIEHRKSQKNYHSCA